MAGSTALGGPAVNSDHDGAAHQRSGGRSIPAGLDLPAVMSLLSTLAPDDGAAAPGGAPDDVPTTLTDAVPTA